MTGLVRVITLFEDTEGSVVDDTDDAMDVLGVVVFGLVLRARVVRAVRARFVVAARDGSDEPEKTSAAVTVSAVKKMR